MKKSIQVYSNNDVSPKPQRVEKKSYSDLLRDPRWQKKRLQIMERDGFMCHSCQSETKTLNVHHTVPYRYNTLPWEYGEDELITLCEDCHEQLSAIIKDCTAMVWSNCDCLEIAEPFSNILASISHLNPWQLETMLKIVGFVQKY